MNKYYSMLQNVLENGHEQHNKKGNIRYLTNEVMRMDAGDLLDIFESHGIARKKLRSELELFCRGERNTEAYREAGISWPAYRTRCASTSRCGRRWWPRSRSGTSPALSIGSPYRATSTSR